MKPSERLKEIERIYKDASESCVCSGDCGESCEGCCPSTQSYEWLITRVHKLTEAMEYILRQNRKGAPDYHGFVNLTLRKALEDK